MFHFSASAKDKTLQRPEGEDTQLLHDVKFARLVKVEDVREEAGIPIKIKLLLLHVIVVTHLQEGGREEGRKRQREND